MPETRPRFRPELEGLRGVAILLVVLFHAGVPALAGGFVGVDVFLVLSGFLVTGLLVRELGETGELHVADFWGRRALRLLPALLVVLLATLALVMTLWAPIDRVPVARTARAVAVSAGNVELARTAVHYFSRDENPLLHSWSLAVEQQFYLVWPLLLAAAVMLAGRRRPRAAEGAPTNDGTAGALLLGIVVAGAVSMVASVWLTRAGSPWAFYGLATRLWEFAIGGAVALRLAARPDRPLPGAAAYPAVGLALVGLAVALYDRTTPYPGMAALLPAAGTALLLAADARASAGVVGRALGAPWLRALGRLSYAWYLWHWPLVGLGGVLDPTIGVASKLAWSGVALALAWWTYRLVERPAREGWMARLPSPRRSALALGASLGAALIAHGALRMAERQAARPEQRALAAAREDRVRHDCWAAADTAPAAACVFGDPRASTVVALLGDSHAEHWLAGLDGAGRARGWKVVAMVKGGCPVADLRPTDLGRGGRRADECARYREAMVRRIVALRPAAAILSSWDHYMPFEGEPDGWQVSPEAWRDGLRRTYARLTAAGIPVVAIRGTPRTWFDVPGCLSRRAAGLPFARPCAYDRARALSPAAAAAQDAAARGLRVRVVDMNDRICAAPRCGVVQGGTVVFTDDNHLTASFTRSLAPVLGARVQGALAALGAVAR